MKLIKSVQKITKREDVVATEKFYDHIDVWRQLYQGHYSEWHDVRYHTLNGEQKRKMKTLNLPKVLSQEMATLVFNEKCDISIDTGEGAFADSVKDVLEANGFDKHYQNYLEYMFAMGGMVTKVYVEDKEIKISYVSAECFVPITYNGRTVTEGAFLTVTTHKDYKFTLVESHLWIDGNYTIRNELYRDAKGSKDLGTLVPLSTLYEDLEDEVVIKDMSRPMFVYTKPNIANNIEIDSNMGISLFANALDTIHTIDDLVDSFYREFKLGKKKIIVGAQAIKHHIDADGDSRQYFDTDNEVYEAFNFGDASEDMIKEINFDLRVNEHIEAINAQLEILCLQTGFSPGTFTFEATGLKTATEVISENSKTYKTRSSHITLIEEGIKELIATIKDVAALYNIFTGPDKYEVKVNFDDSIAEDRSTNASYWTSLVGSGLASKLQAIQKVQKVTEEEAIVILEQIAKEQNAMQDAEVFNNEDLE
ncbi:phage portal protein [Paenalkalicoccus suaedae]|nr:phage portal protein [Paenalkalicoccus suaedae]